MTTSKKQSGDLRRTTRHEQGEEPARTNDRVAQSAKGATGPAQVTEANPIGIRLVVVDVDTLRQMLRELLREALAGSAAPDFYSQTCLPPGMSRRAFLEAIRRGDLPARASGKARFVARADYQTFVKSASPARVHLDKRPAHTDQARAVLRGSQGKK
ncbi:MAG: hypothetical protein U0441_23140 [Polyangiaceae bacterium]